jgi:acetone monooxygenase
MLSAPLTSVFPGQETFKGSLVHTARWPKADLDLAGKRVGIVGNGATGIQVIQTIAGEVGSLKVFVRTPQYIIPMKNPKYGPREVEAYKERFEEFRKTLPHSFTGFEYDFTNGNWKDLTPEQRHAVLEKIWNEGSLRLWLASFVEMFFEEDVSEEISEFVRSKMRARLKDPKLCETLIPTDYGFGTHRVPLESNYLEAYHQANVELISVKNNPIKRITPHGIELTDGTAYELGVIILATGFDAGSGALTRIDIRGRDGRSLKDEWSRDIRTTMGLQVHGYPNLFTTGAPLAPSTALCNMTTCLQQQVEWISDCIAYLRRNELSVIEPTKETEDAWVAHHDEIANTTLVTRTNSWYMGSNVDGKPRRLLSYIGGVGTYRQKCDDVASSAYPGFAKQ